jgi:hypothetical protein
VSNTIKGCKQQDPDAGNKIYNKVFEEQEVKVGKDKILKEIGEDPEEEIVTNRGGDRQEQADHHLVLLRFLFN